MTPFKRRYLVPTIFLVATAALTAAVARYGLELAAEPSGAALPPAVTQPLAPGQKVTFLELGSEGCKPCEAMKPVMQAVRERYGDRVEVVFYDVKKDRSIGREWRIRLIPTQIFLQPDGTEFFRHEGYFPLEEVEKVLAGMGIR